MIKDKEEELRDLQMEAHIVDAMIKMCLKEKDSSLGKTEIIM